MTDTRSQHLQVSAGCDVAQNNLMGMLNSDLWRSRLHQMRHHCLPVAGALPLHCALPEPRPAAYLPSASCAQVWDGTWTLLRLLNRMAQDKVVGKRLVELGSGTGLAGLYAASLGGHVLLTDVPSVTDLLRHNVKLNSVAKACADCAAAPAKSAAGRDESVGRQCQMWANCSRIGAGSAVVAALDWSKVADCSAEQLNNPLDADVVIACEVLWLAELVLPFVTTLATILRGHRRPCCLMTFTHRGTAASTVFTTKEAVVACLQSHGCCIEEVTGLRSVTSDGEPVEAWILRAMCDGET
jgi:predicted nicotinamide N-methyase